MEFVEGTALSKIAKKMESSNIKPGSSESILLGNTLLNALTDAYGSMIFGSGIIHGGMIYLYLYFNHCILIIY